jgi:1,4-dihydroxy-2-naphthoyl-CoA synthase
MVRLFWAIEEAAEVRKAFAEKRKLNLSKLK